MYIQTTTKVHITQTYILYYFHALVAFPVPRFNGFVVAEFCVFLAGLSVFRTVSASSESLVKVLLLGRLASSDKYFLERLLFAVASGSICSVIS